MTTISRLVVQDRDDLHEWGSSARRACLLCVHGHLRPSDPVGDPGAVMTRESSGFVAAARNAGGSHGGGRVRCSPGPGASRPRGPGRRWEARDGGGSSAPPRNPKGTRARPSALSVRASNSADRPGRPPIAPGAAGSPRRHAAGASLPTPRRPRLGFPPRVAAPPSPPSLRTATAVDSAAVPEQTARAVPTRQGSRSGFVRRLDQLGPETLVTRRTGFTASPTER